LNTGQTMIVYTAKPNSPSDEALNLLASWTSTPDQVTAVRGAEEGRTARHLMLDRAAAGALAFEDLVHQLTAVLQAIGVAEQPGPARPAILAVPVPIEVMAMARAGGADGC
jgi:hypothetical protein